MLHLDLFSGIGGFAYAVDQVWENAEHIFCDNDKFCQQVLRKHWPNSKIYGDIRTITNTDIWESRPGNESKPRVAAHKEFGAESADLLTGGFPCQPFSQAGKRKGTADNRFLWPEMLRVIQLFNPQWVIAENVGGILTIEGGMVFGQVLSDLESSGYEVQPFVIPACAVNAPHRRDRVWFVANRTDKRPSGRQVLGSESTETEIERPSSEDATDSKGERLERHTRNDNERERTPDTSERDKQDWNRNWLEIVEETCKGIICEKPDGKEVWLPITADFRLLDDGLSPELDFAGWSKARHRVERLKALGNSIVPQVAIEIMKGIKFNP